MKTRIRTFLSLSVIYFIVIGITDAFAQKTELVVQIGHSADVKSVGFSPDGRFIVTGSNDETAKLWNVAIGRETLTFGGHSGRISSVSFSPDGRYIVLGVSFDFTPKLCLWDVATVKTAVLRFGTPVKG